MKFGRHLQQVLFSEWKFYYLDYDGLKRMIKERSEKDHFFSEEDEAGFVEVLEREMQKVFDFRDVKTGELTRHVQYCENTVFNTDASQLCVEECQSLTEEIDRINKELAELGMFNELNHTGFIKILKKHDKHTEYILKPMFVLRLKSKSLSHDSLDSLVIRLSKLYDILRNKSSGKSGSIKDELGGAQEFIRKTMKFWIHPENVIQVKCMILKYLPVLVHPTKKRNIDLAVSSVYLDNDETELYRGRLEKTEGAEAIRLRWYGSEEPREIFIERKIHREDWTGEVSIKSRFPLKEKHVYGYINGTYSAEQIREKLRIHEIADEENIYNLAKEIQDTIMKKKLKPAIRTFYNRIAFQLPADPRVRISLDTELTMIKEWNKNANKSWKRNDIDIANYPFSSINSQEICKFPYAILEVKLQTQTGQEAPDWIIYLMQSNLVEEVPKFSKFVHGCAKLFPETIKLIPFWFDQMNVDIRKSSITTPINSANGNLVQSESDEDDKDGNGENGENQQEREIDDKLFGKEKLKSFPSHEIINIEGEDDDEKGENMPLLPSSKINGNKKSFSPLQSPPNEIMVKKIHIPVRVEPKVFFANERTFLNWIHFSIFLGGIATALIGLGDKKAKISGLLFTFVSMLFTLYALYLYHWRAERIKMRDPGPYDDRLGPTMLAIVFLTALITNVTFALVL